MLRYWLLLVGFAAVVASGGPRPAVNAQTATREVAVTIDDLPTASVLPQTSESAGRLTRALLAAIARHRVPAVGFVNEGKL
jgi:peptidoglycan/xylan/chitin deacetylase (PgdA/CDA1 family)